ncbi:hypothetical protein EDB19DRAFT_1718637 [Suillus lakei]|nr:hypothetical protein EDB19DRAFT_1718637 [Suillus lakei]
MTRPPDVRRRLRLKWMLLSVLFAIPLLSTVRLPLRGSRSCHCLVDKGYLGHRFPTGSCSTIYEHMIMQPRTLLD